MFLAFLLVVFLFAACAYCVWPRSGGSAGTAGSRSPSKVRAMELLAARDDERHPLTVPPENGPAEAGA